MFKKLIFAVVLMSGVYLFACHDASNNTVSTTGIGGTSGTSSDETTTPSTDTTDETVGDHLGKFKWTHYYIVYENDYSGEKTSKIMDRKDCSTIANVAEKFYTAVSIEGTGYLADGRLINLNGPCSCAVGYECFFVVDRAEFPFGLGSKHNALSPYRSVAADVTVVPFGTKLFIPELVGVEMPDSKDLIDGAPFTHDGCVSVDDEGSGVKGKHLDFFSHTYVDYKKMDADMNDIGEVNVYMNSPKCK